jgi:hypothetical protein
MPNPTPPKGRSDQREALSESERKASREQPESFKKKQTEDKVVEIPPVGGADSTPIKGIDPKK